MTTQKLRTERFDAYHTRAQVLNDALRTVEFWRKEANGLNYSFFDKRYGKPTGHKEISFFTAARRAIVSAKNRTTLRQQSIEHHAAVVAFLDNASPADNILWKVHCMKISDPIYHARDIARLEAMVSA